MDMKWALLLFILAATAGTCKCQFDPYYTQLRNYLLTQGTTCNWKLDVQSSECSSIIAAGKQHDVLQRRTTGRLVRPESQGCCGSCWAFSSAHAYADRLRLSANNVDTVLSPEDLTTCGRTDRNGCCGGELFRGTKFFQQQGAISRDCKPYTLDDDVCPDMLHPELTSPLPCTSSCSNGDAFNRASLRLNSYDYVIGEAAIIEQLHNGPVVVSMRPVPVEFSLYACGIYCQTTAATRGESGHALEIVDYGTENGIDYWVVKNSWGDKMGEEGYWRIRRGAQEPYFVFRGRGVFPVIDTSLQSQIPQIATISVCAPGSVNLSTTNEHLMSVANFAVADAECSKSGGTANRRVTIESIMNATVQTVEGFMFDLVIDANIDGCSDQSIITAEVYVAPNGTMELMDYEYRASAHAIKAGFAVLSIMVLVSFLY